MSEMTKYDSLIHVYPTRIDLCLIAGQVISQHFLSSNQGEIQTIDFENGFLILVVLFYLSKCILFSFRSQKRI